MVCRLAHMLSEIKSVGRSESNAEREKELAESANAYTLALPYTLFVSLCGHYACCDVFYCCCELVLAKRLQHTQCYEIAIVC